MMNDKIKKILDEKIKSNRLVADNKGAALLTVVVVTVFVTIVATTLLYITSMNYQMKQADYQNKQSFYKCETILDDLKGKLTEDVSMAFQESYRAVMLQYTILDPAARQEEFQKAYMAALNDMWVKNGEWAPTDIHTWDGSSWSHGSSSAARVAAGASEADYTAAIKTYMDFATEMPKYVSAAEGDEKVIVGTPDIKWMGDEAGVFITQIDNSVTQTEGGVTVTINEKLFVLKGIRASFVTTTGYSAYIMTDLGIKIPSYDFTEMKSESSLDKIEPVRMSDNIIYMNWKRF